MTEDELNEAVEALIRWLQSQGISVEDSVLVCVKTICVALLSIDNAPKGARAVTQTILDTIKGAGDRDRKAAQPRRRPFRGWPVSRGLKCKQPSSSPGSRFYTLPDRRGENERDD